MSDEVAMDEGNWEIYDPTVGRPPMTDGDVEWGKMKMDVLCKTPGQRAAAQKALDDRDADAFNAILSVENWKDPPELTHAELTDYSNRIDQIKDQSARELAYQFLHERDIDAVDRILAEDE